MRENDFLENDELETGNSQLSEMGVYLNDISDEAVLSIEEEQELMKRIQAGDKEARDKLIQSNLKLVVYMARSFKKCAIPLIDLVQEGNVALTKSVDSFNPSFGYRFSTYASNCILHAIASYINNKSKFVRLPQHIQQQLCAYNNEIQESMDKQREIPTAKEIAEKLNIPYQTIVKYQELMRTPVSLNKLVCDDDHEFGEVCAVSYDDVENDVIDGLLREELIKAMDNTGISKKSQEIIKLIYGFDGPPMTLESIGKLYNVSKQSISQMEKRTIRRLRKDWMSIICLAQYTPNPEKSIEKMHIRKVKMKARKYNG